MKVAIVVLNYNSSADCKKCISFLKNQKGVDIEIIVVDNCSQENERKFVGRLCDEQGCTFIANHENRGYSAGNNIGLRYASEKGYEYALIANPDMEFPQEDYLQKMVETMENDARIGVCSSDIVDVDGKHQNPLHFNTYWDDFFGVLNSKKYNTEKDNKWKESRVCDIVHGCCLMLRIEFLKKVGFMDENTFLYCEERILSELVRRSGYIMYYTSCTTAFHHHIKSEKGNVVRNLRMLLESRKYYYKQYTNYGMLARTALMLCMRIQFMITGNLTKLKRKCW